MSAPAAGGQTALLPLPGSLPPSSASTPVTALAAPPANATSVLCLERMVGLADLVDEEDYQDTVEDIKEEAEKAGKVLNVVIPRPADLTSKVPFSTKTYPHLPILLLFAGVMFGFLSMLL